MQNFLTAQNPELEATCILCNEHTAQLHSRGRNYSVLAELQKRDEDLLAELHHLERSQSDQRQRSRQFPSSLLPVLKAQTAAWVTGIDSQHSNSRTQGKSEDNDGPWGNAPLPPVTYFSTLLSHFQMLLGKTNSSFP